MIAGASDGGAGLSANVDQAAQWLNANQNTDGSWGSRLPRRDTPMVLEALAGAQSIDVLERGINWLATTDSPNANYLARKISALKLFQDVSSDTQALIAQQQVDGGFGLSPAYKSDGNDTALALEALVGVTADHAARDRAVSYLISTQNADGGWSLAAGSESNLQITARALIALADYRNSADNANVDQAIQSATVRLMSKQAPDGSWGSPSNIAITAFIARALAAANQTDVYNKAVDYLIANQSTNGSWNSSAYDTALALLALNSSNTNLIVNNADLTLSTSQVSAGTPVIVTANIRNTGNQTVSSSTVAFYLGNPSSGGTRLTERTIADLASGDTTVVSYSLPTAGKLGDYTIYAVIDPDSVLSETNLSDNSAFAALTVVSVPSAPSLLNPAIGTLFGSQQIDLSWSNAFDIGGGPLTYKVQLDKAPTFDTADLQTFMGIAQAPLATAFSLPALSDGPWYWRVAATNGYAAGVYSVPRSFAIDTTPRQITAMSASPSPFASTLWGMGTTIAYTVDGTAAIDIAVIDTGGNTVRHLDSAQVGAGTHSVTWDGLNDWLSPVADGAYTYVINAKSLTGVESSATGQVTVDGTPPQISGLYASPNKLTPNNDGDGDFTSVTYTLSEAAKVTTRVYKGTQLVKVLENSVAKTADFQGVSWDGTDTAGHVVGDGIYSISVAAVDAAGNAAVERNAAIEVDTTFGRIGGVSVSPDPAAPGADIVAVAQISGAVSTATVTINNTTTTLSDADGDRVYSANITAPAAPGDYPVKVIASNSQGQTIQAANTSLRVVDGMTKSRSWTQTSFADFYGDARTDVDVESSQGDVFLAKQPWQSMADLPETHSDFGVVYKDGKIYVIGGRVQGNPSWGTYPGPTATNTMRVYDVSTNGWQSAPSMAASRALTAAALGSDGKIYVFGGSGDTGQPLASVEAFNPATGQWEAKKPMPAGRDCFSALAAPDGKIYLIGGHSPSANFSYEETASVLAYDPLTDTWAEKAPMLSRRARMAATVGLDGKLYVIGGSVGTDGHIVPGETYTRTPLVSVAKFERYDPATDRWESLPDLPRLRRWPAAAVTAVNGDIYLMGGRENAPNWESNDVYIFSAQQNTWRQGVSMAWARSYLGAAAVQDGRIFALGGLVQPPYYEQRLLPYVESYNTADTYKRVGTLVSTIFDTGRTSVWDKAKWTGATPTGTLIELQTRSSTDNVNWSSWSPSVSVSGSQISSPVGRYIQYKLTLSASEALVTPKASDITISFNSVPGEAVPTGLGYAATHNPTLMWQNALDYEGDDLIYTLQLDTSVSFDSPNFKTYAGIAQASGSTSFTIPAGGPLPNGSTWYWRVAANDGRLTGPWSAPKETIVDVLPPSLSGVSDWPDPFSPVTNGKRDIVSMSFDLSEDANTTVNIYNAANGLAMTLAKNGDIPGLWQPIRSLPDARSAAGAIGLADGRIMVIGGRTGTAGVPLIYDPGTDLWKTGAQMLVPQQVWAVAPGPDGRVFAFGGRTGSSPNYQASNLVQVYDPASNTWSMGPPMPSGIYEGKAALLDGKIYILGNTMENSAWWQAVKFDPATGKYQTISAAPNGMNYDIAPAQGRIYAFGGYSGGILSDVNAYDPIANAWTSVAGMPTKRTLAAAAIGSDGLIYVLGGGEASGYGKRVDAFDPVKGTWLVKGELTTATRRQAAAAVGNRIFVFGGDAGSYDASTVYLGRRGAGGRAALSWDGRDGNSFKLADGTYTYKATAKDGAGNNSTEQTGTVTIDNTPPTIEWVKADSFPDEPGSPVLLRVHASGSSKVEAVVGGLDAPLADDDHDGVFAGVRSGLPAGPHRVEVSAEDIAGNEATLSGEIQVFGNVGQPALLQTEQDDFERGQSSGLDATSLPGDIGLRTPAWREKQALLSPRSMPAAAVDVQGKVHVIGGWKDVYNPYIDLHEVFDPATGLWQTAPPLPTPRPGFGITTGPDGKIYVFGGKRPSDPNPLTLAQSYDPTTGIWHDLAPMPTGTDGNGAVVLGNKIYVVGYTSFSNGLLVHQYDPAANTWSYLGMLTIRRSGFSVFAAGARIYVVGGAVFNDGITGLNQAFDPATKTWREVAPMPTARYNQSGVVDRQGKFWLMGGQTLTGTTSTVEIYDQVADNWVTTSSLPSNRRSAASVRSGDEIYLIGGADKTASSAITNVMSFPVGRTGEIASSIIDAGDIVNWRLLGWTSVAPKDTDVKLATRISTDNVNWSNWSAWYNGSGSAIVSPPGRYIQYKAELTSATPWIGPVLSAVAVGYEEAKPKAPVLESPADGADIKSADPLLSWHNADHAADKLYTYNLQIDRSPIFNSLDLRTYEAIAEGPDVTDRAIPADAPLAEGLWYWRVVAVDGDRQSDFSPVSSFVIDTRPDFSASGISVGVGEISEPDTILISTEVKNTGGPTGAFDVAFYDGDPGGGGVLIAKRTVSALFADTTTLVEAAFDTLGKAGNHSIFAVIDPDNRLNERSEANNTVSRNINVIPHGLSLGLAPDKTALSADDTLTLGFTVANSASATRSAELVVSVVDAQGEVVETLERQTIASIMPGGAATGVVTWNTAHTYAGDYSISAKVLMGGKEVAGASLAFVIVPDVSLDIKVGSNKGAYAPGEAAVVVSKLTSRSRNFIFSALTANLTVSDAAGNEIYADRRPLAQLLPDELKTFAAQTNSGLPPGSYQARATVTDSAGTALAQSETSFAVVSSAVMGSGLSGDLTVTPAPAHRWSDVEVAAMFNNAGNDSIELTATVLVVDPADGIAIKEFTRPLTLAVNDITEMTFDYLPVDLPEGKTYLLILKAELPVKELTLGSTVLEVTDPLDPAVPRLHMPEDGAETSTANPTFTWQNSDHPSGRVLKYRLQIDKSPAFDSPDLRDYAAIVEGPDGTELSVSATDSLADGHWYWRVAAVDREWQSAWTAEHAVNVCAKPDLKISTSDLVAPHVIGEPDTATIVATIDNPGAGAGAFKVDFYDGDPSNGGLLIAEKEISALAARSSVSVEAAFDTYNKSGDHRIFAVVDPQNAVDERSEDNNIADAALLVVSHGLSLTLNADRTAPGANTTLTLDALVANHGIGTHNATIKLSIVDATGAPVADIGELPVNGLMPAGTGITSVAWNTGATYAGDYRIKGELSIAGRLMASTDTTFAIQPDLAVDLRSSMDKPEYGANENTIISARVTGKSVNYVIRDSSLSVTLTDASGQVVFSGVQPVDPLIRDEMKTLTWTRPTGQSAPGEYTAHVALVGLDTTLATSEASFSVLPTYLTGAGITGGLTATADSVAYFGHVGFDVALANNGNSPVEFTAKVQVIDPVSGQVRKEFSKPLALAVNETTDTLFDYASVNLPEGKTYLVVLKAALPERELTLGNAALSVTKLLDVSASVIDETRPRVLVWESTSAEEPLIKDALDGTGIYYRIISGRDDDRDGVCEQDGRDDFTTALRSGVFNQFWLIGAHSMEDKVKAELTEKINAGATIVVGGSDMANSLFGGESKVAGPLGLKYAGYLEKASRTVNIFKSDISDTSTVSFTDRAAKFKLTTAKPVGTVTALRYAYPVIAANNYGQGRALTFGFNPASVKESDKPIISSILRRTATTYLSPQDMAVAYSIVPVRLTLSGLKASSTLRADVALPPDIKPIYALGGVVATDVVSFTTDIGASATNTLEFAVRAPKQTSVATMTVSVGYIDSAGSYQLYTTVTVPVYVSAGLADLAAEARQKLDALSLNASGRQKVQSIESAIDRALGTTVATHDSESGPLDDMLGAISTLTSINADTSNIRLLLDRMLCVLEVDHASTDVYEGNANIEHHE